jgi:hypothetical protein
MSLDEPFLPCPPLPTTTSTKDQKEKHPLSRSDATSWRQVASNASHTRPESSRAQQNPKVSLGPINITSITLPGSVGRNALVYSQRVAGLPKTCSTDAPFPECVESFHGTALGAKLSEREQEQEQEQSPPLVATLESVVTRSQSHRTVA